MLQSNSNIGADFVDHPTISAFGCGMIMFSLFQDLLTNI